MSIILSTDIVIPVFQSVTFEFLSICHQFPPFLFSLVPGRYSNIKETADYLRDLSHAAGGRFHWFRETGVIESDDTKLLFHEIDKAVNFSEKVGICFTNSFVLYSSSACMSEGGRFKVW